MEELNEVVIKLLTGKLKELGIDLANSPWTVYSAIIAHDRRKSDFELISFGSGIKCLPDNTIEDHAESLVHDMHAEIISRRAFISFIYQRLIKINGQKEQIHNDKYIKFDEKTAKYFWNDELELIFYTSQSPCGDASIFRTISNDGNLKKKTRIAGKSMLAAGRETDLLGILRTKPGRADSPFASSLSCSDKICVWNILGVQGALLSQFVNPIYFDVILIGDDFDQESVTRALIARVSEFELESSLVEKGYKNAAKNLKIVKSTGLDFKSESSDETSFFWHLGLPAVGKIVLGFKKGSKRPKKGIPFGLSLQSPLSRQYFFEKYFKFLKINSSDSYFEEKCRASDYQYAKKIFLEHGPFKEWLVRCDKIKKFRNDIK